MYPFSDQHMDWWIKENEKSFIEDLKKVVSVPSIIGEESQGKPFGEDIDRALDEILAISNSLGFRTFKNPEGYYGCAEIGSGAEMIGILGHVDVVPAGELEVWDTQPFDPMVKDGKVFGRGTQDDKGPTLASLYAVKLLMDAGVVFNKRIRFIFGTDEETLWRCMKEYSQREEMPSMGFTPDSSFPLVFAEKGLLQLTLSAKNNSGICLKAGTAFNAVPDAAEYKADLVAEVKQELEQLGYEYQVITDGLKVLGEPVHAQVAETGKNAIVRLVLAMQAAGISSKTISFIGSEIREDAFAESIFGICEDVVSGKLKFNIGKIELAERETLSIDMRIPVTADKEQLVKRLSASAEKFGLKYEEYDYLRPIYVPEDHPLIKTLLSVYREVTGDLTSKPISSGGATYARAMENCVAFGAVFPGREKVEHQPNEYIVIKDIQQAIRIYAKSIYQLSR